MRTEDDAAARIVGCGPRALSGAAGPLLTVGLAATAADLAAGLRVVRAEMAPGQSWAVTTWCMTAALTGAAKSSSESSTLPTDAPVRS